MICNNCGCHFTGSLTCPLCGSRWGRKNKCPVCDKPIHLGQTRCSNCGNPLSDSISRASDYTTSRVSQTNTVEHTTSQNNKREDKRKRKKPLFQPLEMYDYKASNKEIKKRFDEARANIFNHRHEKRNGEKVKQIITMIVGLVFILSIAGSLFSVVLNFVDNDFSFERFDSTVTLDETLSNVNISRNNTNLEMAGNYNQDNSVLIDGDNLYLGYNDCVYRTDREINQMNTYFTPGSSSLYLEGDNLYCSYYGEYYRYNLTTEEETYLFDMDKVLPIGQGQFLYLDNINALYLYDGSQSRLLSGDNYVYSFAYDSASGLVYVAGDDSEIKALDLNGQIVHRYGISCYDDIYVDGNLLYYQDYDGIYSFNLDDGTIDTVLATDEYLYKYTIVDGGIVYTTSDENMIFYNSVEDSYTTIADDVNEFNIVGNYILFERYEDGYRWYFSNRYGEVCPVDSLINTVVYY